MRWSGRRAEFVCPDASPNLTLQGATSAESPLRPVRQRLSATDHHDIGRTNQNDICCRMDRHVLGLRVACRSTLRVDSTRTEYRKSLCRGASRSKSQCPDRRDVEDRLKVFVIPLEFFIFALTLAVVASFHRAAFAAALAGLAATIAYKLMTLSGAPGARWLLHLFDHEWPGLANLFLLLVGFAIVADHFEQSALPDAIRFLLPRNWMGTLALLAIVFVLSIFLDNIAAAIIGGVMARNVFEGRVSTGYLAAIVAAANAGGAGSVIGDTTTTMMWINGVSAITVSRAFVAALAAFLVFAPLAVLQQQRISTFRPRRNARSPVRIQWPRAVIVLSFLATIVAINVTGNALWPRVLQEGPLLGVGLWVVILATALWRSPDWGVIPEAAKGAVFLVALVATAAMMPVDQLPSASWQTALGLGFVSAVFDNIPLTELALKQGGYDWGLLAYAVGFGGSMLWFGSSAGVALSGLYPHDGRSVGLWVRQGWFIPLAYLVGFFALLLSFGWRS